MLRLRTTALSSLLRAAQGWPARSGGAEEAAGAAINASKAVAGSFGRLAAAAPAAAGRGMATAPSFAHSTLSEGATLLKPSPTR